MKKASAVLTMVVVSGTLLFAAGTREEIRDLPWRPAKPVTIIVPWEAGGSADQVTRLVAGILEEPLGERVFIQNQPGDSGSVGTQSAREARHDGYTWTAGVTSDLLDTIWDDWEFFLSVTDVAVVAVNVDTPYDTFDDLLAAFRTNPGQITVATSGELSAGYKAMEAVGKHAGVEYNHVAYEGGIPAATATVAGETEVVALLAVEEVDMLRDGKLRALAVLSDKPLEVRDYGEIPPITDWIGDFEPALDYFGILIQSDAPPEVIETIGILWDTYILGSEELADYAAGLGVVFDPCRGEEAKAKAIAADH